MAQLLIGCDPEVFVTQQGIFKSAYNLIKGDKKNPFKVDKGAVQVDGMALEFNIEPANSVDDFLVNIKTVFHQLRSMVPEHEIAITPVAHFDQEYFNSQPEEALELGCDPDYNGWTREANPRPSTDKPCVPRLATSMSAGVKTFVAISKCAATSPSRWTSSLASPLSSTTTTRNVVNCMAVLVPSVSSLMASNIAP